MNYAVIYNHVIGSGTYIMYLPPGSYYSIMVLGPGPLGLYMNSSTTVTMQILSQVNYMRFRLNEPYEVSYTFVGSSINTTVTLGPGNYYVIIINNGSGMASIMLALIQNYTTAFVNAPIGIVDYGLAPTIGGFIPYSYVTREFIGSAKIYEANVSPITNCPSLPLGSLSLQLNVVLELGVNGYTQYYWLQNVVIIDPDNEQLLPLINVWNMSSPGAIINPLYILGHGFVVNNQTYIYIGNWTPYTTQPSINLSIYVNKTINDYSEVLFGYSLNGKRTLMDNITLLLKPSWGPYLVVNGSAYTPSGHLIDSEFVIGGPGCGAVVLARRLNISLSLYYLGPANNLLPVPTVWSFGSNTGETIINTRVIPTGPATVLLTTGGEYLGPLVNANYIFFLSLNNYLVNGALMNVNIPLPVGSRVFLTVNREFDFGNGTMIRLIHVMLNGKSMNVTSIMLTMNDSYVVNYVWARYYHLWVVDESNQLVNMSGWYLDGSIINITVSRAIAYLGNNTRLVFNGFMTNATHYLTSGNSIILLISSPTILILDWIKEYNVSLILYTINGTQITREYLGWLLKGYEITNITINGINYKIKTLIITKPSLTATVYAEYRRFIVRDIFGIPEPFTTVEIRCGVQVISATTNALGLTPNILTPINTTCIVVPRLLGYYSIMIIAIIIVLITVTLLILDRGIRNKVGFNDSTER
jgi:hypothetical protein